MKSFYFCPYFPFIKLSSCSYSFSSILISTVLILVVWMGWQCYYQRRRNFPPGPLPWPVVGNLFQIQLDGRHLYKALMEWSEHGYGKLLGVKLGLHNALVINEPSRVRELFEEYMFSGRPQSGGAGGCRGILTNEGSGWEAQRRFTLRHLRDFGFGKRTMESLILEEAQEVAKWMKEVHGQPLTGGQLRRRLSLAVMSGIWTVVSGEKRDLEDGRLDKVLDALQDLKMEGLKLNRSGGGARRIHPLMVVAPWLRKFLPGRGGIGKFQREVDKMIGEYMEAARRDKGEEEEDEPLDFIDSYLEDVGRTEDPNSSFYGEDGEKNLGAVVGDLFHGGSETTGITLTWAILFLMTHPQVQKRLQAEIDSVIGHLRIPTLYDRLKMPYTEAVIMETSRLASVVPLGVFHSSLGDTHFHSHFIPRGTWVFANLYAIHMDGHVWTDPDQFNPERFLSKEGDSVLRFHESYLPFSAGKRECPGKSLANDMMFLFITSIFQRFIARPEEEGVPAPNILDSQDGYYRAPKKFSVVMKERATVLNNPIVITFSQVE